MCFFLLNENLICMFDLVYHSMACNAGKNRKQNDFLNFMYGNYIMRNEAKSRFIFYWYRRKIKKNCDYSQMDPWLILINPESDKNSSKKEQILLNFSSHISAAYLVAFCLTLAAFPVCMFTFSSIPNWDCL